MGVFDRFRKPEPEADILSPTPGEPGVDNIGLGSGDPLTAEQQAEHARRWNEWSARTRKEHAEAKEKSEAAERKAREESERRERRRSLLDRIPPIFRVESIEGPLVTRYGFVEPWAGVGWAPIATPAASPDCPDSLTEHRRRVLRYQALPSDSDEREDLGDRCWAHGGMSTGPVTCPVCFPGLKRRRQREEERKQRGAGGFSFGFYHRPEDSNPLEPHPPKIY